MHDVDPTSSGRRHTRHPGDRRIYRQQPNVPPSDIYASRLARQIQLNGKSTPQIFRLAFLSCQIYIGNYSCPFVIQIVTKRYCAGEQDGPPMRLDPRGVTAPERFGVYGQSAI
jgi:hypothetical protein